MSESHGKKTALFEIHRDLGARMVPFAGYLMPLRYSGQIAEHQAVRAGLGLFDLSHMGEFRLSGPGALEAADGLVTNRLAGISDGQAVYSPMCQPDGGIVDDIIVYNLGDSVLMVVNAANIAKDKNWVTSRLPRTVSFSDQSDETASIAVQGPKTEPFLDSLTTLDLSSMETYTAKIGTLGGVEALISRTGYTGEDGFELYVKASRASELWARLMTEGKSRGITPVGLAARDTLRFEMGYCLYGNDIDETTTPLESGLGWTVKLDGEFVGRDALAKQKEGGVQRRLVGLIPEQEKIIPRTGYAVFSGEEMVGKITSGTFSPSLEQGLGLAYVRSDLAKRGEKLEIDIRGKRCASTVTRPPFYTQGSRKKQGES